MKTKVSKTITLNEAQLAKLFGKEKMSISVSGGYYDPREGSTEKTITLTWTEEEEFSAKL